MKLKTCVTWTKHSFLDISSTNIDTSVSSHYQCVEICNINSSDRCFGHFRTFVSTSATKAEPLSATDTSHFKQVTFLYEYHLPRVLLRTKTRNRILHFGSTLSKHGRHFYYRNQPLNMRMSVFYLNCHEVWLCCYLLIEIKDLLYRLQLFYFHFWPIYCLSPSYKVPYRSALTDMR
jgi:hypothetical protein